MTVRTFLDTGVLFAAYKGDEPSSAEALRIIEDDAREFVATDLVRLELLPNALYHKNRDEVEFYELYLQAADVRAIDTNSISVGAFQLASEYGLQACDALHVHSAISFSVDEFITTEKTSKPFFRVPPHLLAKKTSISAPVKAEKKKGVFRCLICSLSDSFKRCLKSRRR